MHRRERKARQAGETAIRWLGEAALVIIVTEFLDVPSQPGVQRPTAAAEPVPETCHQENRGLRLSVAAVVESGVDFADPVRRSPPPLRNVQTTIDPDLIGKIDVGRRSRREVGMTGVALSDDRIRRGQRCNATRKVHANTISAVAAANAAVLVAGREVREDRERDAIAGGRLRDAELRRQVQIADPAVAEAALIEPAVDESRPIAALTADAIKGERGGEFPAVG